MMSDTQDEIIWKLERKKSISALYSHIAYFSLFCVFLYILLTYFTTPENLKDLLAFLALTFFVCYIARDFYYSLNLKTMYIENNHLFIEKYLGKNIVLPLGDFIIFHRMPFYFNFMFIGDYSIESIRKHSLFPMYFFLEGYNTNVDEIQTLLKPFIVDYLLKCDEKAYNKFKIFYGCASIKDQYSIDYKEIDRLREEKQNND